MKATSRLFVLLAFLAILLAACDSGTSTLPQPETTTIIGKMKIYSLNGLLPLPYDNVTVRLVNSAGGGYTETALSSGLWAFRKVIYDEYTAYATKAGYGRSEDIHISTQNPKDSILLTLAEEPHVTPTLDSISGSWDSGYLFYVHMPPEGEENVDILVRAVGTDASHFGIILIGTQVDQLDSDRYVIHEKKRPAWMPANPEFAAVAYNPTVSYYVAGLNQLRYCSEGPLSNVMRPQ